MLEEPIVVGDAAISELVLTLSDAPDLGTFTPGDHKVIPTEDAPAEEAPTEEAPTEEAPTEEAPTEDPDVPVEIPASATEVPSE
jgi:hypothetical protein